MEQRKSRVINSREFLKYLWKKKIFLILIMVVCIVLVCIYYGFSHKTNTIESIGISSEEEYDEKYNALSKSEKVDLDLALKDYELYENSWAILQNSIIMKIDAYNARQVNLQYKITIEGDSQNHNQYIDQIASQYVQYVIGGGLGADVAEKVGYDSAQIIELIDAGYNASNLASGVFTIYVFGTEIVDGITEAVQAAMEEYPVQFADANTEAVLTPTSVDIFYIRSSKIFDRQKLYENDRSQIKTRLNNAVSALTAKAFDCYEYKTSKNQDVSYTVGTVNNISAGINIKGLIKYAVVGLILGLILGIVILLFRFQFAKKIIAETDYTQTMGLSIISKITENITDDMKVVIAKLAAYCEKNKINKLAVLTSSEKVKNMLLSEDEDKLLVKCFTENGIEPVFVPNVCKDTQSMMKLFDTGHAVLIEKRGDSDYADVYDEVILCRENRINIVGVLDVLS